MTSARLLVTLLLFPALVAGSPAHALAADDECQAGDVGGVCALNALQLRAHKAGEGGTVSVRLRPEEPDEAEAEGSADEQVEEAEGADDDPADEVQGHRGLRVAARRGVAGRLTACEWPRITGCSSPSSRCGRQWCHSRSMRRRAWRSRRQSVQSFVTF